jgi:hypothetical protein
VQQRRARARFELLAQSPCDRVTGAISDLEKPLPARPAAARKAIAPVRAGELDSVLFEPVDGGGRLAGQHLHEARIRRLVRALHYVLRMDLRRIVLPKRGLDAALRLRRVARLERRLRRKSYPRTGPLRRDGRGETSSAAAHDEHVERGAGAHR